MPASSQSTEPRAPGPPRLGAPRKPVCPPKAARSAPQAPLERLSEGTELWGGRRRSTVFGRIGHILLVRRGGLSILPGPLVVTTEAATAGPGTGGIVNHPIVHAEIRSADPDATRAY